MHTLRFVLIFSLLTGCAGLAQKAPENVNLSGSWVLNTALSDTLPAPAARQRQKRGFPGGMSREGNGGMGQRGAGGGFPRGRSGVPPNTATFSRLPALTATEMIVEQDDASVGIDYSNQPYRDIYWGTHESGTFEVEAGWQKDAMVVRSKNTRMKLTETFALSEDGTQLQLTVKFSGGPFGSKTLSRVFDRKVAERDASKAEPSLDLEDASLPQEKPKF